MTEQAYTSTDVHTAAVALRCASEASAVKAARAALNALTSAGWRPPASRTAATAPAVPDSPAPASAPLPGTVHGVGIALQRLETRIGAWCRDLERQIGEVNDRVDEHLTPSEYDPADDEPVQALIDESTRRFAAADGSSERVEVIRDLLDGWYAAWPSSAVTDPHEPIAWHLVSLIDAAEARASKPAATEHPDAEMVWLGDLAGYRVAVSGGDVTLLHRCGWTHPTTIPVGSYLANLIDGPVSAHRDAGCNPAEG